MREAVKILSTKGLIGQRPRVGTYVHPEEKWDLLDAEVLTWILDRHFSHSLVREFLEVRIGIEPAAAALAAVNATSADKELLKQKLEKMQRRDQRPFRPGARGHRSSTPPSSRSATTVSITSSRRSLKPRCGFPFA